MTEHSRSLPSVPPKRISILGATGSIGLSTLDLLGRNPDAFDVVALTAQNNADQLADLALRHKAKIAAIGNPAKLDQLRKLLWGSGVRPVGGDEGLIEAASEPADCIVAAIVGAAGLKPTFAAARQGTRVALANKECLVSAGDVFLAEIAKSKAELLPVDSEHSAAFQALNGADPTSIEKIVLTASGGPFRTWDKTRLLNATPEEALRHPNWSMGAKITIDSATLMNKGLELIEAFHLFPVGKHQLDTVVHPQSLVHALVYYKDGSVLAQLGPPDMRTPISLSLAWPARMATPVARLDLISAGTMTFEAADEDRFPALRVAKAALHRGETAPAILNAANEIAVAAFLNRQIGFMDIASSVEAVLNAAEQRGFITAPETLDDILAVDQEARDLAATVLS